jgi:hypothetical protein
VVPSTQNITVTTAWFLLLLLLLQVHMAGVFC